MFRWIWKRPFGTFINGQAMNGALIMRVPFLRQSYVPQCLNGWQRRCHILAVCEKETASYLILNFVQAIDAVFEY